MAAPKAPARRTSANPAMAAPYGSAQSDDGNRDYYRNSDTGIECTHAIRAALGRDGYIAWLRGTQMKYLWRGDAKDQAHPAEYAVKVGWYANELARVLADPEA